MYPQFHADTYHYALTCNDPTTLDVTAQTVRSSARMTLLRDNPSDNAMSVGNLDARVTLNDDHDIAIELSDTGGTAIYVVHCLPSDFPDIVVLTKTAAVSDGFLFLAPHYEDASGKHAFLAVLDNNGVPRFHRSRTSPGWDFRPVRHTTIVSNREVRYLHRRTFFDGTLEQIATLAAWKENFNSHDFLITERGTFVGIFREPAVRDFSAFSDSQGNPYGQREKVLDSVIREFSYDGTVRFY